MTSSTKALLSLACLMALTLAVFAAPVVKNEDDTPSGGDAVTDVQNEDEDLQELLNLVHKEAQQDDVMVHKEHVTHIENNNGQSVKVEQKEEKVVDTDTGKVLADVKQQVQSTDDEDQSVLSEPVVETEVDVPAQGVHQTFLQGQQVGLTVPEGNDAGSVDSVEDLEDGSDLTPADIAAYLYASQQFDAFYAAMDKLVNESKMTVEDAAAYTRTVALEYERLQLQDMEDRFLLERRSSYPQTVESDLYGAAPGYDLYPQPMGVAETADQPFDMLSYVISLMSPGEQEYMARKQAQADLLATEETIDPYQFVATLWNEAYENGNEEAQEIVRLLYDRVSQDSNPDDMGEIRDILLDTVAQSLEEASYPLDTPIDTPLELPEMSVSEQEEESVKDTPFVTGETEEEDEESNVDEQNEEEDLSAVAQAESSQEEEEEKEEKVAEVAAEESKEGEEKAEEEAESQ